MESAFETNNVSFLGVLFRDFDSVLVSFSTGVNEHNFGRSVDRNDLGNFFSQTKVWFVLHNVAHSVEELASLFLNYLYYFRVAVAHVQYANAASEVEHYVAVDVLNHCTFASCYDGLGT